MGLQGPYRLSGIEPGFVEGKAINCIIHSTISMAFVILIPSLNCTSSFAVLGYQVAISVGPCSVPGDDKRNQNNGLILVSRSLEAPSFV